MDFNGRWTNIVLLALTLLTLELYAASPKRVSDEAQLTNYWTPQNSEKAEEEPSEEYVPLPTLKMLRRSALDNDIFANGLRWRRKRSYY